MHLLASLIAYHSPITSTGYPSVDLFGINNPIVWDRVWSPAILSNRNSSVRLICRLHNRCPRSGHTWLGLHVVPTLVPDPLYPYLSCSHLQMSNLHHRSQWRFFRWHGLFPSFLCSTLFLPRSLATLLVSRIFLGRKVSPSWVACHGFGARYTLSNSESGLRSTEMSSRFNLASAPL